MSDIGAQKATPFAELERQMMDTNFPKNEREWWSWREINNLRDTITRLTAEVELLTASLQRVRVLPTGSGSTKTRRETACND